MQTILFLIRCYRAVFSPWFGNQCRFYPTCSAYAEEAISAHGSAKGLWLAFKRIGKCHPWNAGGIDPVPPNNKMKENHG